MIGRVRGQRTFAELSRGGRRISRSPVWCTWCLNSTHEPALAFAITRAYGSAVKRNRLRRRIRAIVSEVDRRDPLPPIVMLFGMRTSAKELTFEELRTNVTQLLTELRRAYSA